MTWLGFRAPELRRKRRRRSFRARDERGGGRKKDSPAEKRALACVVAVARSSKQPSVRGFMG
jgi:hypothetical protein